MNPEENQLIYRHNYNILGIHEGKKITIKDLDFWKKELIE